MSTLASVMNLHLERELLMVQCCYKLKLVTSQLFSHLSKSNRIFHRHLGALEYLSVQFML